MMKKIKFVIVMEFDGIYNRVLGTENNKSTFSDLIRPK